jgi:hypothetical protein
VRLKNKEPRALGGENSGALLTGRAGNGPSRQHEQNSQRIKGFNSRSADPGYARGLLLSPRSVAAPKYHTSVG